MPLEFYHHTQRKFIIRPVESPDKRFCIIYTLPCGWSWSETSHPVGKNDFRTALPSASACVTETKFPDESFLSPLLEWVFVGVVVLGSILFLLLVGICWCQCCPHSCCCYVRCCCCPDTCCCPKHCEYTNTHMHTTHVVRIHRLKKKTHYVLPSQYMRQGRWQRVANLLRLPCINLTMFLVCLWFLWSLQSLHPSLNPSYLQYLVQQKTI